MRSASRYLLLILVCGFAFSRLAAQCPDRPNPGTVVEDALSINSVNGVLNAELTMRHSVDTGGYNHYCYNYQSAKGEVEAPTLRLNQSDRLLLDVKDRIESDDSAGMMEMPGKVCGDTGMMTLSSTNVHFHGLNVPPICHQDDVLTTLIQPNKPAFRFDIQIPKNEPPGALLVSSACTGVYRVTWRRTEPSAAWVAHPPSGSAAHPTRAMPIPGVKDDDGKCENKEAATAHSNILAVTG